MWLADEPLDEQDGGATGDPIVVEIAEEVVRPSELGRDIVNVYSRTVIREWPHLLGRNEVR